MTVFLAATVWTLALMASELAEVSVIRAGATLTIPDALRGELAARVQAYFETCSLNSRDDADIFEHWNLATIWQETAGGDHLLVRLDKPMKIRPPGGPPIPVELFMMGLEVERLPYPELTRQGDQTLAYSKCSGQALIEFVCAPDVEDIMPESYLELCDRLGWRSR